MISLADLARYAGRSQNELATSLGVDQKTLRRYTAPALAAERTLDRPLLHRPLSVTVGRRGAVCRVGPVGSRRTGP